MKPSRITGEFSSSARAIALNAVRCGATHTEAAALAKVAYATFRKWVQRGKKRESETAYEFWMSLNAAKATAKIEALTTLRTASLNDPRYAKEWIETLEAQEEAHRRSQMSSTQLALAKIKLERERVELDIAKAKLAGGAEHVVVVSREDGARLAREVFGSPSALDADGSGEKSGGSVEGYVLPLPARMDQ